ncbi:MAG: hypothetical protein HEQ16_07750 [Bosea sp.]|nr:hypothetical protein [Bosea sp. (in: a-proteobacteria)]
MIVDRSLSAASPRLGAVGRKLAPAMALAMLLAGCGGGLFDSGSSPAAPAGGSTLGNMLRFGSATAPAPVYVEDIDPDELVCPPVSIVPGGAAVRIGGGSSESVRSQITITDVARECARAPGGGVTMRVGAEGRVLVGPAGSAGTLGSNLRIEVRRGDQVVLARNVRVGATVPSGQAQAGWTHIEPNIVIPAATLQASGDTDVFISLGGAATSARRR